MKKVLTCILNDKAGSSGAAEAGTLVARMATEQNWEARIAICAGGAELNSHAEQARAVGGLVVGAGGDGTIAATAAALVDMDAVLGVLPMETLNHFAKDLSIPRKLEEAVQTLFSGRIARVDVGEVNGRVFPNISSIGFYPRIVQEREREQQRGRSKWIAFAKAAALVFQQSRTLHVKLETADGLSQSSDTPFVFIGNNRYAAAGLQIGGAGSRAGLEQRGRLRHAISSPPHMQDCAPE